MENRLINEGKMPVIKKIIRNYEIGDKEKKSIDILDLIRKKGPIARTDISRITGYNIVTVSNYIENYIKNGLVFERGYDTSTGGRRPVLVEMNNDAAYVAAVGLNIFDILGVIVDLKANVKYEVKIARPSGRSETIISSIVKVVEELLGKAISIREKICGIGVGMPGIIDVEGRTVRWPIGPLPTEDAFISISLKELFENKFKLPVLVENDADCAVFGEKWLALNPEIKNILYMYSGVSCGIIIDGNIYEGATGVAGELGICNFEKQSPKEVIEYSYHLGRWDLELGMLREARESFDKNKESLIYKLANNNLDDITLKTIIAASKENDLLAMDLLEKAGFNLGKKIAFLVNLLNPEVVIIGGGLELAGAILIDAIKKSVKMWALDEVTRSLKIIPAQLGERAITLGAGALTLKNIYAQV